MKSVLVTGGAGFIGSHYIRYLLREMPGVKIVNLDCLSYAGSEQVLAEFDAASHYHFVKDDINNRSIAERLLHDYNIETIVHFAAESHVDRSISGPDIFIQSNIVGTFALLEVARKVWLQEKHYDHTQCRFHHISTDEVFGTLGPDDPPFKETTPYAPNSPYSASKASSDHLVRAYFHTYNLPVTTSNCSNNYGPFQHHEKFIPTIIRTCLAGESIPIYGDGKNIRDWLYVEDHCGGIQAVINRGRLGETYNIGGRNEWTNIDIVHVVCDLLDEFRPRSQGGRYRDLISFVTDRPGHDRRYAIDQTKITEELNWTPTHVFEQGIRKTVQWYLDEL